MGCPGGTAFDLYACGAEQTLDEPEQLREQGGQRRKFHPTQPPMCPVGSWDGLEVVQGVQVGQVGGPRQRSSFASSPYKWLAPGR
jgi:hypothetical protein